MGDAHQPEPGSKAHAALGIGLAALTLAGGIAFFLFLFGFLLRRYGFGIMLLFAFGGILAAAGLVDLVRKLRGSPEPPSHP